MREEDYNKIIAKKEFSQLPRGDVEKAYSYFEKREVSSIEKIRLTRDLLHKVFGAFISRKLLSIKNKDETWFLRKHISTKERFDFYPDVYSRIFSSFNKKKISVIDLGAGINGLSYKYFPKMVFYVGIEAVGQLVMLMNDYFYKNNIGAISKHLSLFDLQEIKNVIKSIKGEKVVFLFKTLDSLEMLERDYSKKLLKEIVPLVNRVVVSFATRSLIRRKRFRASRKWIRDFVEDNFVILDNFNLGGEEYLVFCKKR